MENKKIYKIKVKDFKEIKNSVEFKRLLDLFIEEFDNKYGTCGLIPSINECSVRFSDDRCAIMEVYTYHPDNKLCGFMKAIIINLF